MNRARIEGLAAECVAAIREITDAEFDDHGPEKITADAIATAVAEAYADAVRECEQCWLKLPLAHGIGASDCMRAIERRAKEIANGT